MPKRGENIHKRKDGRWEGRYKKETAFPGKPQYASVYGKTYSEVKAKLKEISQLQPTPTRPPNRENTFAEVLHQWQALNNLKHKGATETKYTYLIEKHIIPELGEIPVSQITTSLLNEFVEHKIKDGRLDRQGGLSPSYVRGIMIIVTSALQYAVNEGMRLPLATAAYKPVIDKKELKILTPKEQEIFESYLLSDLDETKLGVILSLNCGLRIGEVCALRWEDIDFDYKIIRIRTTVARVNTKNSAGSSLIIDRPKTKASLRDVPIHSTLYSILKRYRVCAKSEYVISTTNQFVSPRTYEYRFHRLLDQCGLDSINYHALRHTFATRCIMAGVDVKTLSEILGHADVSITLNTYVHPSLEMKLNQIEKINSLPA